ncbi:uncharacterized protein LOC143152964 [Ptiloglossa arizonensis]|uniref:uncharacterized protein LOC143152964 n=1 Tax=Ptiloglossa arizonensis TaxID=3350558 RepID=UPI003F9F123A
MTLCKSNGTNFRRKIISYEKDHHRYERLTRKFVYSAPIFTRRDVSTRKFKRVFRNVSFGANHCQEARPEQWSEFIVFMPGRMHDAHMHTIAGTLRSTKTSSVLVLITNRCFTKHVV